MALRVREEELVHACIYIKIEKKDKYIYNLYMKIYCQQCGQPNEYASLKPNFCPKCGNPFAVAKAPGFKVSKPALAAVDDDEDSDLEDEEDSTSLPDIDGLSFDIDVRPNVGVPFKDVMGTATGGEQFSRDLDEPVDNQTFLKNFSDEAGSSRPFSKRRKNKPE